MLTCSLEKIGALCVQELALEMFAIIHVGIVILASEWTHTVLHSVFSVLYTQVQTRRYRSKKNMFLAQQQQSSILHFFGIGQYASLQLKIMLDKNASLQLEMCIVLSNVVIYF